MVEFDDNKKELKRNEIKMDELKRDNHKLKGQIEDLKREKVSGDSVMLPSMVCCIMCTVAALVAVASDLFVSTYSKVLGRQ